MLLTSALLLRLFVVFAAPKQHAVSAFFNAPTTSFLQLHAQHQRRRKRTVYLQTWDRSRSATTAGIHCRSCHNQRRLSLSVNDNNNNNQQYDLSKAVFDFYALRMVRGDALTKYNSLNQSEPLRINLSWLSFLFCIASPWLLPELTATTTTITTADTTTTMLATAATAANEVALPQMTFFPLSLVGAVGSAWFGGKECQARNRQLIRLEKECAVTELRVQLPTNPFADAPYQKSAVAIRSLLKEKGCRILAVSGSDTDDSLRQCVLQLWVLGQRLQQANTYVVIIPTTKNADLTTTTASDLLRQWNWSSEQQQPRWPWLAQADDLPAWQAYFASLTVSGSSSSSTTNDDDTTTAPSTLAWFGLSSTGRSFGSGTTVPSWIQILGKSLSPVAVLDESDSNDYYSGAVAVSKSSNNDNNSNIRSSSSTSSIRQTVLQCQQRFYDALVNGKLSVMQQQVFDTTKTDEAVSQIVQHGGRLDLWDSCLLDEARPVNMKVSGCDCLVVSDREAYTTCIEFPATANGSTLLAVQHWMRLPSNDNSNNSNDDDDDDHLWQWKLIQHQTIPWTPDQPASGTLLCDCRGCVSLVRRNERRTFGGLLG